MLYCDIELQPEYILSFRLFVVVVTVSLRESDVAQAGLKLGVAKEL